MVAEDKNVLVLAAMLGTVIKLYDDIVDMKNPLRFNEPYMLLMKSWIVYTTLTIFEEQFIFCPLALVVMTCSYIFGCLDDVFWYEFLVCILVYVFRNFDMLITISLKDIWLIFLTIVSILYEEIAFPEELSYNKANCRLNGCLMMAFLNLFIYFSGIQNYLDFKFLTTFVVFGQSYCLMSVVDTLLDYSLLRDTTPHVQSTRTDTEANPSRSICRHIN